MNGQLRPGDRVRLSTPRKIGKMPEKQGIIVVLNRLMCSGPARVASTTPTLTKPQPWSEGHVMAEQQSTVEYRDIPGFPGYRVGNDGSVWSCLRQISCGMGKGTRTVITGEWRQKAIRISKRWGRPCVALWQNSKAYYFQIHTLVLLVFVGPRPTGMQCCHGDGDKTNNHLSNLRWDTSKANCADKWRHGTQLMGERNPAAKLTESDVQEIRRLLRIRVRPGAVAQTFRTSTSRIRAIAAGQSWGSLAEVDGSPFKPIARFRRWAKLTEEDAAQIIDDLRRGELQKTIAARHGVARASVSRIRNGDCWADVRPEISRPIASDLAKERLCR